MERRQRDWASAKALLAAAASQLAEGATERDPEAVRRILQARARAAARPDVPVDSSEHIEVVAFTLAGERYGVESTYVRESCQLRELTPLPCTPPFVAGVMKLRGEILVIADLRRFFGLPARGLTELNRVVVLGQGEEAALGLLADSVEGVHSLDARTLGEGLPTLTGARERFLVGVTSGLLAVLDGKRLLEDATLKVNEEVTR